jgi:hypothetical protein
LAHYHAADLASLAKKPEATAELAPAAMPAGRKAAGPCFPWGCCIHLEDEQIAACFGGEMPPAGAIVHGCFVGMVKASVPAGDRIDSDGVKTTEGGRVEIEMRELGFAAEDDVDRQIEKGEVRKKTWYAGGEPDGDEG